MPRCAADYQARISGPLFDRIDLHADGALLGEAVDRLRLSARGYHRVLRVARTLADLDGAGGATRRHVAEALSYRRISPARAA